jgi:hypothetical protein
MSTAAPLEPYCVHRKSSLELCMAMPEVDALGLLPLSSMGSDIANHGSAIRR